MRTLIVASHLNLSLMSKKVYATKIIALFLPVYNYAKTESLQSLFAWGIALVAIPQLYLLFKSEVSKS
jgi:hypothetical protein